MCTDSECLGISIDVCRLKESVNPGFVVHTEKVGPLRGWHPIQGPMDRWLTGYPPAHHLPPSFQLGIPFFLNPFLDHPSSILGPNEECTEERGEKKSINIKIAGQKTVQRQDWNPFPVSLRLLTKSYSNLF